MPTTFKPADADDQLFMEEVRDEYEKELTEAKVRVKLMFACGDYDKDGNYIPPMVKKGVRSVAEVKINAAKLRSEGLADATITYDYKLWEEHGEDRRRAVLHHELHHLKVRRKKNEVAADDLGRPLLDMRPHDFEVGWFHAIASIHGEAAIEVQQARRLTDGKGQMVFPWCPDAIDPAQAEVDAARSRKGRAKQNDTTVTLSSGGVSVTVPADEFHDRNESLLSVVKQGLDGAFAATP